MDWDLVVEKAFPEVEKVFLVEVVARSEETSDSLVHVVQSLEGGQATKQTKSNKQNSGTCKQSEVNERMRTKLIK